jgi:hypothetical protein
MAAVPAPVPAPERQPLDQHPEHQSDTPSEIVRLQGRGVVYRDGQSVGDTEYDLMVVPPHHDRPALTLGITPSDHTQITGILNTGFFFGEIAEHAGTLTLVLADGRRLDFKVLVPDTNEIVGVGELKP